jgi:hypothetical protein
MCIGATQTEVREGAGVLSGVRVDARDRRADSCFDATPRVVLMLPLRTHARRYAILIHLMLAQALTLTKHFAPLCW